MNCVLQGTKSCHLFGCGRTPPRKPTCPARSQTTCRVVTQSKRAPGAKRRQHCCRVRGTSEPSTSVSTSAPTYGPTQKGVPRSQAWELDFCSRPLLDERGKKRWELLICSPDREFEYSAYFPNNKINSTQVCCLVNLALFGDQCAKLLQIVLSTAESGIGWSPATRRGGKAQTMSILPRANADNHLKITYRPGHCTCS